MRRHVAPALAGLCLAAVVGAPAFALEAEASAEAEPTVTFNGSGLGVLICSSNPDRGTVSTTAGTWINVVNHTGFAGTLRIGQASVPFGNGEGKALSLSPGSYRMQLVPNCGLNLSNAGSVGVEVAARAPVPASTSSAPQAPRSSGTSAPTAVAGSGTHAAHPAASAPPPSPVAAQGGRPIDGEPPALPSTPADEGGAVPTSTGSGDIVAVQPFQPVGLTEPPRANRLLALVATIGVIGVTIAAIRAIMAQRARRSATA